MAEIAWPRRSLILILALAGVATTGPNVTAQEIQHLTVPQPGGMPGLPTMTGVQRVTNGVSVTWYGPPGYHQLYQTLSLSNSVWQRVGGLNLTNNAIVAAIHGSAFFRVAGPSPVYSGAQTCAECHVETHDTVMRTRHTAAFTNAVFVTQGGQTNSACLSCHTVGFTLPTGFINKSKTPQLASVQCENCHGPATRHAANPDDLAVRPRVEIAAAVCGGCHAARSVPAQVAALHPPYYEEWNSSGHRAVRDDVKADFSRQTGAINSCGRCHSGTVREALLEGTPLPGAHEAGAIGIACATCHEPHERQVHTNVLAGVQSFTNALTGFSFTFTNNTLGITYTNQLREPLASLRDYHSSGHFTTNYNPSINTCAQCHNDRGASSTNSYEPPHRSPQYNLLLGTVGELTTGQPANFPATHSRIERQCVACHMQTSLQKSGHQFAVTSYDACARCHGSAANAQGIAAFVKAVIIQRTQQLKAGLDQWALQQSPTEIRAYGTLAWEYQKAGRLSSPDGTLSGPVSDPANPARDEQKYIPSTIKRARFNLYLVLNDGSHGVHNGPYAITLLDAAENWIQTELGN